jgi:hypothetical protein
VRALALERGVLGVLGVSRANVAHHQLSWTGGGRIWESHVITGRLRVLAGDLLSFV